MPIKVLFLLFIVALFNSCIKEYTPEDWDDSFSIVVSGEIETELPGQVIRIHTTINNAGEQANLPEDLLVEVFEENNPVSKKLTAVSDNESFWQMPGDFSFHEGETYFLKISPAQNIIPQVKSEVTAPRPGSLIAESAFVSEGETKIEIDLTLEKSPNFKSYYHINVYLIDAEGNSDELEITDFRKLYNGAEILTQRNGILIDYDKLPEDKHLSFYANILNSLDIELLKGSFLHLNLKTVTEDYYLYHKSLSQLTESNSNPFLLPTTTFTNISNGYGLFALHSTVIDSIVIE